MSLNLTVHGNPSGHSGPAIYCQELTRALSEEGVNIALSANSPINHQHVPKDIIKLLDNPGKEKDPLLSLETPLLWWKYMAYRRPFIGSVVFEGDRIPYGWVLACTQQETDQIWCPSFHTASAVREGAIATRQQEVKNIKIIPHGYNPELFNKKGKKADIYDKEYFTFLYVGGWSKGFIDRKGLDIVYRAFKNEFKEYEKVRLIVKITSVYNTPGYNPVKILSSIPAPNNPKAQIITQDVPRSMLQQLYRCADVTVYPSKAEGFGMTALESMACGTPVMTAPFGGQVDFINKDNGWIVTKGTKTAATDPGYIYDFSNWFVTDWQEWAKKMRHVFEHQNEVKKKRKKALEDVKQWTWKAAAKKAIKALKEI